MVLLIHTDGTSKGTVVEIDGEEVDARLVHFKVQVGSGGIVKVFQGDLRISPRGVDLEKDPTP